MTARLGHVTLTHDEFILSRVIQNLDELYHVGMVQFFQDGDLAMDIVQGTADLHARQSTVGGGMSPDRRLTVPGS